MSAASRIVPAVPADLGALEAAYARIAAPPGAAEKTLLAQAFDDYSADETPELGGDDLAVLLAGAWRGAEAHKAGEPARITEMDALVAYLQILGRLTDAAHQTAAAEE